MLLLVARRMGITLAELDQLTVGLILDMCAEASGDTVRQATQENYESF